MSLNFTATDRKLVIGVAVLFALVTVVAVIFSEPEGNARTTSPTTYSAASNGAKAAYLMLKVSGWNVERWEQSPSELPKDQPTTYIIAEPREFPTPDERASITTFVREGGRLIVAGSIAAEILPTSSSTSNKSPQFTWSKVHALAPSALTPAPEISIRADSFWDADSGAYVPLYGEFSDKAVAIAYAYGKGKIIWWASATPITNGGINQSGNLEFLLACLGGKGQHIYFDEYFHGHRPDAAISATGRALWWMLAQVGLLGVALILTYSRRSGPIRVPRVPTRLSPLEFVETLGGLYERAHATEVPIDIAQQRFRYRLTRRLGLPANASIENIQAAAADLLGYRGETLREVLRACEIQTDKKPNEAQALEIVTTLQGLSAEFKLYNPAIEKMEKQ